ncbi:olfactory receptor CB1 [Synchiropus picturatus]
MRRCSLVRFLLPAVLMLGSVPPPVSSCDRICGAQAPGDMIIGVLLSLNRKVTALHERTAPESFKCSDFDIISFLHSLSIIHEIEKVNAAGFIPGLKLGYMVCDTCSYASKALENVEHMLTVNMSKTENCGHKDFRPAVKAILGARYSEVTIAVARLLSIYQLPLVSATSSSPDLSDKTRFTSALRTVPSDVHQTKAVAKIMDYYHWNWVGVVYGDDDYGKAAFQSFQKNAEKNNVCLAFQEVVPHYLGHQNSKHRIQEVAEQIRASAARVVLLILKEELVELLFKEMIRTNTSRVWIASDAWSRNRAVAHMEGINLVGDILGFSFVAHQSDSLDEYLQNLTVAPGGFNNFIEQYKNFRFNCSSECFSSDRPSYCPTVLQQEESRYTCSTDGPQGQNDDYLVKYMDSSNVFSDRIAVWTIAHAIRNLLKCNASGCSGEINFPPWKLLQELKKVDFQLEGEDCFFDKNGDFVNGYDLLRWETEGSHRKFTRTGRYHVLDGKIEMVKSGVTWITTGQSATPQSKCSESCPQGSFKKILNVSCCYSCTLCLEGTYSDKTDLADCKPCPNGTWSLKGWSRCERRRESFLQWRKPYPIAMVSAAVFGILLLVYTLAVFLVHRDSAPMRKAEVRLSCVMMAGLAVSFGSVICFMGRPSLYLCQARQVMYAMGFTLCVSCILIKAYRTFLAFLPFGRLTSRRLYKIYKPPIIISVTVALQGIICLLWLIFDSPDIDDTPPSPQSMKKVIQCKEGDTFFGFGIMLSYIGLLALFGFLLAFKGRKVPQEFSETGYIIFSMLMYLFVWVCFVPIYITNNEERTPVQASAILVSSYGIIFCHFLPKCYEVFWGSPTDTMTRILRRWRNNGNSFSSERATHGDLNASTQSMAPNTVVTISEQSSNSSLADSGIMPSIYDERKDSFQGFSRSGTQLTKRQRSRSF